MRCLILGALIIVATTACGGPSEGPVDMRKSSPVDAARKEQPGDLQRTQSQRDAIRAYSAAFSADAVDTCVRAFDDENLRDELQPVDKPSSADLRAFLCACVAAQPCL